MWRLPGGSIRAVVLLTALAAITGCGGGNTGQTTQAAGAQAGRQTSQVQPQYSQVQQVSPQQAYGGGYRRGTATGDTQEGADFARWVLDQDPTSGRANVQFMQ